jgi:hypothetical protein
MDRRIVGYGVVLALACGALPGQSPLTTLWHASTWLASTDGAVYFDLVVSRALELKQIDCDLVQAAGARGEIDVWVRPGTWSGHTAGTGDWAPASSGPVRAAALDQPSVCVLRQPVELPPGRYGIALHHRGVAPAYTMHLLGTQTFANGDLALVAGGSSTLLFGGSTFATRVWNGALHYSLLGAARPIAAAEPFGEGCYAARASFYEAFAPGAFDLDGQTLTLLPNAAGGYDVQRTAGTLPMGTAGGVDLGLARAGLAAVALPFALPFPGGSTGAVVVAASGQISLDDQLLPIAYELPSAATLLAGPPRLCAAWRDLAPTPAANVHELVDAAAQTVEFVWAGVPVQGAPAATNTFAVRLHGSGVVELSWLATAPVTFAEQLLVGWSPGNHAIDPGSVDLSAAAAFATARDATGLRLDAVQRPIPGRRLDVVTRGAPPGAGPGAVVLAFAALAPPLDLGALGAPGCSQYLANPAAVVPFAACPATTALRVPAGPAWLGLAFAAQSIALAPAANALGAVTSNGLAFVVGPY